MKQYYKNFKLFNKEFQLQWKSRFTWIPYHHEFGCQHFYGILKYVIVTNPNAYN